MGKISPLLCLILLIGFSFLIVKVKIVEADGVIYIRADGRIDPPSANITSSDNVTYYFTDNNYDTVVVERNNITNNNQGILLQSSKNCTFRNNNIVNSTYNFGVEALSLSDYMHALDNSNMVDGKDFRVTWQCQLNASFID
jgi:parallel beta-helix repeat protein